MPGLSNSCPECRKKRPNKYPVNFTFRETGNWDNPVKILPGLHHSGYFLILTGLVHHIPVKHVLSGKDSPPNQVFAPCKNLRQLVQNNQVQNNMF
jgi:hypothetical protein